MKDKRPPSKRNLSEHELTLTRMAVVSATYAFGVEAHEIMKVPRGHERLARARQTVYWLLRKTGMTYPRIGALMGKDHVSAMHGVKKIESIMELNMKVADSACVRRAFNHFKEFYNKYDKKQRARSVKEMENAF